MQNVDNNAMDELEKFRQEQQKLKKSLESEEIQEIEQITPGTIKLNGDLNFNSEEVNNEEVNDDEVNELIEMEGTSQTDYLPKIKKEKLSNKIHNKAKLALESISEDILSESIEVYLPGLKTNAVISPIKNIEDLNIKTKNVTFYQFLKDLNSIIYTHTLIKDNPLSMYFETLEDFEQKILPIDRTLLIYILIKNSFTNLTNYNLVCENCEKEFLGDLSTDNLDFEFKKDVFHARLQNYTLTKEFLNGKLEFDLGFNPEETRLKLLKKSNDEEVKDNLEKEETLISVLDNLILFIKSIKVYKNDKRIKTGKKLIVEINYEKDGFDEVYDFIHNLPLKLKDSIINNMSLEELEEFSPSFFVNEVCPYCGHINKITISPEIEFFRKALSLLAG